MATKQERELNQFLTEEPRVRQAVHILISLLRAAQGTITDDNQISFVVQAENSSKPQLTGNYRVTIKALEEGEE